MASDSENEVSSRASDNTGDRQEGSSERQERMLDDTQRGAVAEGFGKQSSEQRSQDSQALVQAGSLPDLQLDLSSGSDRGGSNTQRGESNQNQFKDPALDTVNEALQKGAAGNSFDQTRGAGRDNQRGSSADSAQFKDPALDAVNEALQKGSAGNASDQSRAPGQDSGAAGRDNAAEKKNDASDKPATANPLTPPEPVTFENIQPSGYTPGSGGSINGGRFDNKGRLAPTTSNFFDKKNPTDYVSMAVDQDAHIKDGQLFYSKELDQKYAKELAEKYPNQKPEDRHMWLRAVDSGGAFKNTWGPNGPSRADIAVSTQKEADKINEHGHAKKNPADAISLTMVPESDKDRVAALSKMPVREGSNAKGRDFGYRDEYNASLRKKR